MVTRVRCRKSGLLPVKTTDARCTRALITVSPFPRPRRSYQACFVLMYPCGLMLCVTCQYNCHGKKSKFYFGVRRTFHDGRGGIPKYGPEWSWGLRMRMGTGINLPDMPRVWTIMVQRLQYAGGCVPSKTKAADYCVLRTAYCVLRTAYCVLRTGNVLASFVAAV